MLEKLGIERKVNMKLMKLKILEAPYSVKQEILWYFEK